MPIQIHHTVSQQPCPHHHIAPPIDFDANPSSILALVIASLSSLYKSRIANRCLHYSKIEAQSCIAMLFQLKSR